MTTQTKRRMYGMIYRARRKGSDVNTRKRTIYRAYSNANCPPQQQERVLMREYGFGIQLLIK
jgi:hypothetical protein